MPSSLVLKMARFNRDKAAVFSRLGASLPWAASTAGRSSGSPSCSVCESHLGKLAARDARSTRWGGGCSIEGGQSSGSPSCRFCGSHQGKPASRDARNGSRNGSRGGVLEVRRRGGALAVRKTAPNMNGKHGRGWVGRASYHALELHARLDETDPCIVKQIKEAPSRLKRERKPLIASSQLQLATDTTELLRSAFGASTHVVVTFPIEGFTGVGEVARLSLVAGQGHRCRRQ